MSNLKCIFGHNWGAWYRGLQPLNDEPSMQETSKCKRCGKLRFRKVWL